MALLDRALSPVDAFDPSVVVVSLGVDTYVGDPMCDLALTTDGFRRCGAAVAALGRPLVVLQEGGYADDALGANVTSWLLGADGSVLSVDIDRCDAIRTDGRRDQASRLMSSITLVQRSGSLRYGA